MARAEISVLGKSMLPASLSPVESSTLAEALRLFESGRVQDAANRLAPLIVGGSRHPDLLMVYSAACERLGKVRDAVGALQAAIEIAPERADLWANLGRVLHEQGQSAKGAELLERAVQIDDAIAEYWYNLGLASGASGRPDRAIEALLKSTDLSPRWAMAWAALGQAQLERDEPKEARGSLAHALELDPNSAFARHTLALALRRLDCADEALDLIGERPASPVETRLLRAHLLGDSGRLEDAAEAYREILREQPQLLDAHETLARLLPQIGAATEPLGAYREALAKQPSLELYRSAIGSARELKDHAAMLEWSDQAQARFGRQPDLMALHGLALGLEGRAEAALAELEPLAAGGFAPVLGHCAYYRLKLGDLPLAEAHALAATKASPEDQTAWAYLTIIWRLMEDPREAWLADYEQLVIPITIAPPEGFESTGAFMEALADDLRKLHTTVHHPLEQSLREGTQTRGLLFNRQLPTVQALAGHLDRQISDALTQLPADTTHPFLGRNTGKIRFAGSWSVRLRSGGFHINHIHHIGWISSALYVSLPEGMGDAAGGTMAPGSLAFGIPDTSLGLDLPPRRVEPPRVGRLLIFPSYFWHGTIPFESDQDRLTVAFDALPR
jgi:tetratricopeptide (TPR) repeat protein